MKKLLFLLPVIILFVTACGTRELQEARYKEKITQLVPRAKAHQISRWQWKTYPHMSCCQVAI
jgi:hypothetical protein